MNNRFILEVSGLEKYYNSNNKKITALNGVSFNVESGTIFGLLGPNGAGKTTTIKILTTITRPDSGSCIIRGFDITKKPYEVKKLIGVVPQENNLDRELTVYENLLIYGMLYKLKNLKKKIKEILELVGLWERKDSIVSHLSGGMQRRLLISRALITEPIILFLDEPTVGLDPQIRHQIWDLIRKIRIEGRTVFLTTHYIEEAEALCNKVGILCKGKLIALGVPEELKSMVGNYVVEHIDGDGRLVQKIFKNRQDAYKCAIDNRTPITIRETNLEDVFIKLTGEHIE